MANANSTKRQLNGGANCLTGDSVPLPNLPGEIITEILVRLPVKSLLKFRCVSKHWLSIISSPQFVKTHLNISTNNNMYFHNRLLLGLGRSPSVFLTLSLKSKKDDENYGVDSFVFDYLLNEPEYGFRNQIVGSCNGLVCVDLDQCGGAVLWNPTTRKLKKLPISDRNLYGTRYGFGYDALNDDYKVFAFSYVNSSEREGCRKQLKVYSSRADSWRNADWPGGEIVNGPRVFVNGSIHWEYNDFKSNWAVMAQNVATQACSFVELPKIASDDDSVMLGISGGCLCLSYDFLSYMNVWVMKEYGLKESWTKLFFPYPSNLVRPLEGLFLKVRPKVLFVSVNGEAILSLDSDLGMYKSSQLHKICRLGNDSQVAATTYNESLLSPHLD